MQAATQAEPIDIADALVVEQVELVAVPLFVEASDAEQDFVTYDRKVEGAFELAQLVIAEATADIAAELAGRFGRCEQDCAAGGIATEQRALGSLQNLYRL